MANEVDEAFARIRSWSEANFPALIEGLNPGLTEAEIANATDIAGSEQLKQLYRLANGERRNGIGFFFGLRFMPIDELSRTAQLWRDIAQSDPELADDGEFHSSDPEAAITAKYINSGWIAFAHDYGGNHLSVDTAPGPAGTAGQIINSGRDEERKRVIAGSLASFLSWMADTLEQDNCSITATGKADLPYEFLLAEPPNTHLLDAVQKMNLPV
ncbi:SMI1/KNR4 family protein [Erythrobacter donghaensis]|uniref:SMI1/KNR4 family protein n=1 Tax=Erythrobacter donghaensis TaxID=267135 RepID=UPI0013027768|nr:SMI1/KNR4 family protein [Erythrobacter donghaensis]